MKKIDYSLCEYKDDIYCYWFKIKLDRLESNCSSTKNGKHFKCPRYTPSFVKLMERSLEKRKTLHKNNIL